MHPKEQRKFAYPQHLVDKACKPGKKQNNKINAPGRF
jgi:hypothetical protein